MPDQIACELLNTLDDLPISTQPCSVTKTSRRARNDQKWNTLKDVIHQIYIIGNFTLQNTKRVIEDKHGFKASERKWKEKLTEWNFDKNITTTDMTVLVAKAEKRLLEEGKETLFYMGTSQITRERIEQFKRRKVTKEFQSVSPEADTPKNITYHTPPHDPPPSYLLETDTEDKNGPVLESDDGIASWFPYPGHGNSLCVKNNERRNRLSNVLELASEIAASEGDLSASGTLEPYTSSDTGWPEIRTIMHNPEEIEEPGPLLGHESAAEMDRVVSRILEKSTLCSTSPPPANSELQFSRHQRFSTDLDYLSRGVPRNLPFVVSRSDSKPLVPLDTEPLVESDMDVSQSFIDRELDPIFISDNIPAAGTSTDFDSSEDSLSDTGFSMVLENDAQALKVPARLYSRQKQKALELREQGWSMARIFQHLVACGEETALEFCQRLWKLCLFFQKAHFLEETLIGLELIQAGLDIEFGAASKETMRCLVFQARVLQKMKRFQESENLYRQAISGFRTLRQRVAQLKCQMLLANLLRSLKRTSEALQFLLEALIEHFGWTRTSEETRKVVDILESIQILHIKMELGPDLTECVSRLKTLQHEWPETRNHLKLFSEFVQLGGHYSKLGKYELADLFFAYRVSLDCSMFNTATRIELMKCSRELSLHYQRQRKLTQTIEQLKLAVEQFSDLLQQKALERTYFQRSPMISDKLEQDIFATLGELLNQTRPAKEELRSQSYQVPLWSTWRSAEAEWAKLHTLRRTTHHNPIRNSRLEDLIDSEIMQKSNPPSFSSHASSKLSSSSVGSRFGLTYSVGSASSIVSNSVFMVP